MDLRLQWTELRRGDAAIPAFTASPTNAQGKLPAIIVIQEIWGVDDHIQDMVRRFATAGYFAAAPDIYAHGGTRLPALAPDRIAAAKRFLDSTPGAWGDMAARDAAIEKLPEAERAPLRETLAAVLDPNRPIQRFVDDLKIAAAALRADPRCTGRVGSVGYCMGGLLSALLAGADPELGAAAIYYGTSPDPEKMRDARAALIGFYGESDTRVTGTVPPFEEAMKRMGKSFEAHVYPGAPHAFFNDGRPSYRVDAARDAWARTLLFFDRYLAGGD